MTRETAQKLLKNADLMAVYASGGHIQERVFDVWTDSVEPSFDRPPEAYRIKPREPREFWITYGGDEPYQSGANPAIYGHDPESVNQLRTTIRVREILPDETP